MIKFSNRAKILVVSLAIIAVTAISIYFHLSGKDQIFPQIYYIPILMLAIFWGTLGWYLCVLFALSLPIIHIASGIDVPVLDDISRALVMCTVSGFVAWAVERRKKTEYMLRESMEKYYGFFKTSRDCVFFTSKDGRWIDMNDVAVEFFGYGNKDELIKVDVRKLYEDPDIRKKLIEDIEQQGFTKDFSANLRKKDGSTINALITSVPRRDKNGNVVGFQGTIKDITENKQAETIKHLLYQIANAVSITKDLNELLRIIQQELSTVLGTKNFFIALYNKESDTISLPLFKDERGHFESFPGGKTLTSYVLRNNKPLLVTAEDIDKMVASGEVEIVGARSKVWLGAPLEAGDKVVGALVAQDYTDEAAFGEKDLELLKFISSQIGLSIEHKRSAEALKESEERYRTLFENAPIGIGLATLDGRILDGNDNMFKLTGYSREELKQKALIDTYQDPEKHDELLERLQKEGLVRDFEAELKRKDGIIYHAGITVTMFSLGGKDFILTMIEDITERKRLEDELLKAQKLDSIGVLAGGIAHDFNNILTAIIGNITLAKMDVKSGDEIFEILTEAEKASGRAKDLTQQLLTFSKGRTPVKKTSSIAELTKDSAGFILRGSNVKCKFFIPDDLWPVEVDEGQMSQVINNLLINAAQAMPEGGIIEVQAENIHVGSDYLPHLKDEKYIKFSIKDHGIGISEEYLPKIFDPYFTTKQEGSGLGLGTCYAIVKNHDGYLFVESELEVGTTFSIYLPACLKDIPAKQKVEEKPLAGGGKILIMDDEEMVRKTAGRILKSIGYEVAFAQDGAEAIELYKKAMQTEGPFDAVIIDLTVPGGMGAKESIKKLLEIDPGVKAIVSSGYSNDPVMANCREYGFCAAILKPYKLKELSEILQGVITTSG